MTTDAMPSNRRPAVYRPPRAVQLGGLPDAAPIPLNAKVTVYLPDNERGADRAEVDGTAYDP